MRIYFPATLPQVHRAVATGVFHPPGGIGFAVTEGLQAEYPGADAEDLEYLSMHDAALASLRLIAAGNVEPVRVVLQVEDDALAAATPSEAGTTGRTASHGAATGLTPASHPFTARDDLDRAVVTVAGGIRWDRVTSVHLDGGEVADVVRAAAAAVDEADLGDMNAAVVVGEAEDIDLAWYRPSEIGYLITELESP